MSPIEEPQDQVKDEKHTEEQEHLSSEELPFGSRCSFSFRAFKSLIALGGREGAVEALPAIPASKTPQSAPVFYEVESRATFGAPYVMAATNWTSEQESRIAFSCW